MFNVNRSIDDLIAAGELDPMVIATKVADQVPLNELRSLVAVLIRQRVRDRFGSERRMVLNTPSSAPETMVAPKTMPSASPERPKQPFTPGQRKRDADRWVAERLAVKVKSADQGYMLLGDCTEADFERLTLDYTSRAQANQREAAFYAQGAALMAASKKKRLRDVPKNQLSDYLRHAA